MPESKPLTLKLEGKLAGPWVTELEQSWNVILRNEQQRPVAIDLTDVTFISTEGKELLKSMLRQGTNLQSRSLMTRFILSQIKNESNGNYGTRNGG
ncbi:MAG TPA: hypothetical protein VMI06_03680 [Terriglobia bacterium]|nr:hypothetical protein [Terriglobia bacterium]